MTLLVSVVWGSAGQNSHRGEEYVTNIDFLCLKDEDILGRPS